MKKYIKYIIIVLVLIVLVTTLIILNINRNKKQEEENGTTKIVTSFYPMYIIAENLTAGAENIELVNMADVNVGCLHDYTLTTEDMKKVEDADIFISNGLGMESFIDKILSSNADMKVIDSSTNIDNFISNDDEVNGHIWTNIEKYIKQVKNISEGLQQNDSANSEVYKKNTDEYLKKLNELKDEFNNALKEVKGKKAVVLNEAFEYLGQELELDMIVIKTDHEESTISAEVLKQTIDAVKNEDIEMIIIDKNDNKSNAETIAFETGAKIFELNSGSTGDLDKDAYINAVRENINTLKETN